MIGRSKVTRRIAIGVVAAAVAAVVAVRELPLLRRHHFKRTPYDDLMTKLDDRDAAASFGKSFTSAKPLNPAALATLLRARLKTDSLAQVSQRELAQGRVLEVGGWIVPETFTLLCALAARAG
jgi:hypothetical protein